MFLINLIPLHVLALMATGRFSHRVYIAYTTVRRREEGEEREGEEGKGEKLKGGSKYFLFILFRFIVLVQCYQCKSHSLDSSQFNPASTWL